MSVLNTLDLSQKLVLKLLNSLHQQPDITDSTSFQSKPQQQTQHNTTQHKTTPQKSAKMVITSQEMASPIPNPTNSTPH